MKISFMKLYSDYVQTFDGKESNFRHLKLVHDSALEQYSRFFIIVQKRSINCDIFN